MESTTWKLKTFTKNGGSWRVVYYKDHCKPLSVEITRSSISLLRDMASGVKVSVADQRFSDLRKLGCISVYENGNVPEEVLLSGLGRQMAIWLNNVDI